MKNLTSHGRSSVQPDVFLKYFSDAKAVPADIGLKTVTRAIWHVCAVTSSKWSDIHPETVLDALNSYSSDFRSAQDSAYPGGYNTFASRLRETIRQICFFERCAQLLLSIPKKSRPRSPQKRLEAIRRELRRGSDVERLRRLDRAGLAAIPKIELFVQLLELNAEDTVRAFASIAAGAQP